MHVPSLTFREPSDSDPLRADEVEVTAEQRERIEGILRDRKAMLAARPHRSKGSRKRAR